MRIALLRASDGIKNQLQDVLYVVYLFEKILDFQMNFRLQCILPNLSMLDFHPNWHQFLYATMRLPWCPWVLLTRDGCKISVPRAAILAKTSSNLQIVAALSGKSIISSFLSTSSSSYLLFNAGFFIGLNIIKYWMDMSAFLKQFQLKLVKHYPKLLWYT